MRTIKFRGKVSKTKQWVYGDLLHVGNGCIITTNSELGETLPDGDIGLAYGLDEFAVVIPDTVGQFTGLLDKNGKEVYEGDIVKTKQFGKDLKLGNHFVNVSAEDVFEIKYINAQFVFNNGVRWFYLHRNTPCEIIGNIHDNPELLKTETL